MSDTREKLIELIENAKQAMYFERGMSCSMARNIFVADYLIANGVTVQKWIPVSERLPEKEEYTAKSKDGTEYYVRLLIAYKTDIVEYEIGYYDGYKWLSEMPMRIIKDVIAWKQFEPLPELLKGE